MQYLQQRKYENTENMKYPKSPSAVLSNGNIALVGRISYPKLFKAEGIKNDPSSKPRFGCGILLPKTDKAAKKLIDDAMKALIDEKLDGTKPKAKDLFIKDGDGEEGDEFSAGCWVLSANRQESQGRPTVLDRDKSPLTAEDGKIFAGYWCQFVIGLYVPKGWKKVCASLEVVRFVAEDETFGAGRVDPDELPDDLPGVDDDEDEDEDDGLG